MHYVDVHSVRSVNSVLSFPSTVKALLGLGALSALSALGAPILFIMSVFFGSPTGRPYFLSARDLILKLVMVVFFVRALSSLFFSPCLLSTSLLESRLSSLPGVCLDPVLPFRQTMPCLFLTFAQFLSTESSQACKEF